MFPFCPSEVEIALHCTPTIYSPAREPSTTLAVPPMIEERSGDDTILCLQNRFRDTHSRFLRLRIGSSRQEGFGICQANCDRVNTTKLEMRFATGPETHPTLIVDLRGGIPTGRTRSLTDCLEPFPEVSS